MTPHSLYDTDFYAWTVEQAKLLGHQQWDKLDLPNLIIAEPDLPEQTFPPRCLYSLNQVLAETFYPGEPSQLD